MRYWAFSDKYFHKDISSITMKSGRKVLVQEGDHVILFERSNEDVLFKSYGLVSSVALEDLGEKGFYFKAILSNIEIFEQARHLEDFSYSLIKIYRYEEPARHFHRRYLELSDYDIRTLVEAKIYWARTGFGYFINQLPQVHLIRFMSKLAETEISMLLQQTGYNKAWQSLRNFIEEEYVSAGRVFESINKQLDNFLKYPDIELNPSDIFLSSDEDDDIPDSIDKQVRRFSQFTQSLFIEDKEISLLREIDRKIEQEQLPEETFQKSFKGIPWPISMIEG